MVVVMVSVMVVVPTSFGNGFNKGLRNGCGNSLNNGLNNGCGNVVCYGPNGAMECQSFTIVMFVVMVIAGVTVMVYVPVINGHGTGHGRVNRRRNGRCNGCGPLVFHSLQVLSPPEVAIRSPLELYLTIQGEGEVKKIVC